MKHMTTQRQSPHISLQFICPFCGFTISLIILVSLEEQWETLLAASLLTGYNYTIPNRDKPLTLQTAALK